MSTASDGPKPWKMSTYCQPAMGMCAASRKKAAMRACNWKTSKALSPTARQRMSAATTASRLRRRVRERNRTLRWG
ncbi:MAG: hypothetical protein NTY38_10075 [Acidobacteria bacterium]|nr:hypothetical protein [Acidobacteriota bacterium]